MKPSLLNSLHQSNNQRLSPIKHRAHPKQRRLLPKSQNSSLREERCLNQKNRIMPKKLRLKESDFFFINIVK